MSTALARTKFSNPSVKLSTDYNASANSPPALSTRVHANIQLTAFKSSSTGVLKLPGTTSMITRRRRRGFKGVNTGLNFFLIPENLTTKPRGVSGGRVGSLCQCVPGAHWLKYIFESR